MTRRIAANLLVFLGVFLVMCVWAVRNVITIDAIEDPYSMEVDLAAASGLAPDAEVAYLGVHYGRIGDIELSDGGVRAELKIDDDKRIPRGSIARVFRKSAIGEPYIDFQPPEDFDFDGADEDDYYAPGDLVPVEDTRTPIEFSELLRTASDVISSVGPERAAVVLHELALALEGRGEDLRTLTEGADRLAATFAARTDALDRLAVNNTRLTSVLADHRSSLGQTVSDLAALSESLRNASGDTRVLLDRGAALLQEVGSLVAETRPDLDCILDDLGTIVVRTAEDEQVNRLARHLDIGPAAYARFGTTRDIDRDGPWVRVNLLIRPGDPARQYDPPLELPPVPEVTACPDVHQAGAGAAVPTADFHPADVMRSTRSLPAPSSGAAALGAGALAAFGLTAHRRGRRGNRG